MKRVVITGMGVISSLGNDIDTFWKSIKDGKCGIDIVKSFDISEFACQMGAEATDFVVENYIDKKSSKKMDRFTQFAVAASKMALDQSKFVIDETNAERVGVIIGSGVGGFLTVEQQHQALLEKGPSRVSPFFIPMMISNMAPAYVAIQFGAKGINETVVSACASGTNAIGDAFKVIKRGDADVMITGGTEAPITPLAFAGFSSMKAMSTNNDNPKEACRPFDADRDGFIMGEGAGMLILEELEHARKRKAEIIAEIVGYGATDDAFHITQPAPDGEGGARAMAAALKDANIKGEQIDYINAHGTSTFFNDKFETTAIKNVFKEHAKELRVSSTKSMTGHLLGAAGGVEAIICALSIKDGFIPATINYKTPDPECDLDYVPNQGVHADVNYALSNSLGFGGHNATIILKKYAE